MVASFGGYQRPSRHRRRSSWRLPLFRRPTRRLFLILYNARFRPNWCNNPRFPRVRDRQNRPILKNRQSTARDGLKTETGPKPATTHRNRKRCSTSVQDFGRQTPPAEQPPNQTVGPLCERRSVDRERAKSCIGFLKQPMGRSLHVKLREAYSTCRSKRRLALASSSMVPGSTFMARRRPSDTYPAS